MPGVSTSPPPPLANAEVDSSFAALSLELAARRGSVGVRRAWRRAVASLHDLHAARGASAQALSFNWRRLSVLTLAAMLLAAALSAAGTLWLEHRAAAQRTEAALAAVESLLDGLAPELERLTAVASSSASALPNPQGCASELVEQLVRSSLQSPLARQFFVQAREGELSCGAFGPRPRLGRLGQHETGLTLWPAASIRPEVEVVSASGSTWQAVARLDVRMLRDTITDVQGAAGLALAIGSPGGAQLARVGDTQHGRDSGWIVDRFERSSARHGFSVTANLSFDWLLQRWRLTLPAVLAATLLVVLGAASLAWRACTERSRLDRRIAQAQRKRQFEPFVQPIVDLASGRCTGGEVLMRWHHPQRGILGPAEFIDEAERSGLIVAMADQMMSKARHRLAPIVHAHPQLTFAFNVTPAQLRTPRFGERLATLFDTTTLPSTNVLLEVTERDFVDEAAQGALNELQRAGWRTAIDDFGTGQSSLAALEKLAVDRIKIDRAFVSSIGHSTVARPVLDAIVSLATQLRVPLVAEGIETSAQWDYLRARGVQYAQGYLIARPMPIDEFARWLAERDGPPEVQAQAGGALPLRPAPAPLDDELRALWQRMRSPGGLDVRDRVYRLHRYEACFIGCDAVDWLVARAGMPRANAVRLGQRMAALGLLRHVLDEHDFKDAALFYRLAPPPPGSETPSPAMAEVRAAMRTEWGPLWRNRSRGFARHHRCASGREIIHWLSARFGIDRSTAQQWAGQLMRLGALRHVFDDTPFRDDENLYRPG